MYCSAHEYASHCPEGVSILESEFRTLMQQYQNIDLDAFLLTPSFVCRDEASW